VKKIGILLLLGALIVSGVFYFRDTEEPRLTLSSGTEAVSAKRPLRLQLEDPGSGLNSIKVVAVQGEKAFPVFSETFGSETLFRETEFGLQDAPLKDGPFELRVTATDHSIYHFGAGNTAEETYILQFDSRAPVLSVVSSAHNLNQGGSALIVYTISEEVDRTGVMVGDFFFPGYLQESGNYACFFALPYHMSPKQFAPELIAEDRAGNQRRTDFYHHANPRSFPLGKINLDERFLKTLQPRFEAFFPEAATPLELFLKVNGELRKENVRALRDFGKQTASGPLWEGVFLRQPNAAHLGGFAAARSYFYEGKKVDDQTHMGVDLASVAQAPIPAANAGKVVHADDLGIYGKCIIIDHGMGLQSLYGHLSRIDVEKGEIVAKGQTIGNSGATGLAGGDHLHFEIILSGLSVNPVEWWDPAWLKNNVGDKLSLSVAK
jgi:murein DD-endopeptidase MepM/ murein hydrolase activator NlpD